MQLITERQNIDNYLRRVTSECISRLEGVLIEDEAVTATRELLKRLQALVPGSCSVEDVHRAINGTLRKTYGSPKPTCGSPKPTCRHAHPRRLDLQIMSAGSYQCN